MKAGVISMGCPINVVDTEHALGVLAENNVEIVRDAEQADLLVVNACMHTREDKQEAINTIFKMYQEKKEHQKIVVMGCFAEHYADEIKQDLPEVDACIPIEQYDQFGAILSQLMGVRFEHLEALEDAPRVLTTRNYWSYVRIADGAIPFYTNCAFPSVRGDYHSRSIESIVDEITKLVANGMKEVVLVAPSITRYGQSPTNPNSRELIRLLTTLLGFEELKFIRFYPLMIEDITHELIDLIAANPRLSPFFDLPIFHTSARLIQLLNRTFTLSDVQETVSYIRQKIPHAIIHTAIVTGIPSETQAEFDQLIEDLKLIKFDVVTIRHHEIDETSPYVKEIDLTTPSEKTKRKEQLVKIQKSISHRNAKRHIGFQTTAIITGFDPQNKQYRGRSYAFMPGIASGLLLIDSPTPLNPGDVVTLQIDDVVFQNMKAHAIN